MAPEAIRRPAPLGARGLLLLAILLAGVWAMVALDLAPADLVPSGGSSWWR